MNLLDEYRTDRALLGVVGPSVLRKCSSHSIPPRAILNALNSLTPEQQYNINEKCRFRERCKEVLGQRVSVRGLSSFFQEPRTTLHERMRLKRTDLAPLESWFERLDECELVDRLLDEALAA